MPRRGSGTPPIRMGMGNKKYMQKREVLFGQHLSFLGKLEFETENNEAEVQHFPWFPMFKP